MSEGIKAPCPKCGAKYRLPATAAGKRVVCRKCNAKFAVSARQRAPAAVATDAADDFGALANALAEVQTSQVATAAEAANAPCVSCRGPVKAGAVICLACGADQRTGKALKTKVDKPAAIGGEPLSPLAANYDKVVKAASALGVVALGGIVVLGLSRRGVDDVSARGIGKMIFVGIPMCVAIGTMIGSAAACALAPASFLRSETGGRWMQKIGTKKPIVARIACSFAAAAGITGMFFLARAIL